MALLRLLNTVRYLRPVQVTNRIGRRLVRPAKPDVKPGEYRLRPREASPPAHFPDAGFDGNSLCLLNRSLPWNSGNSWHPGEADLQWLYQLHGFRYIWGLKSPQDRRFIENWIRNNPPVGGTGWDPYPISMRVREWIEWLHAAGESGSDFHHTAVSSIAAQAWVLCRKIEYHLLANHLLENAITLCWAGLSLEGPESEAWLAGGRKLLAEQLREQVLPDGVHFERSPMYQASIAESLLRLAEVADRTGHDSAPALKALCLRGGRDLLSGLERLVHPDGQYALFNDTVMGQTPSFQQLTGRFPDAAPAPPPHGLWSLPNGCFLGWNSSGGTALFFDAGPIGPGYQPGHGHAGCLSFELSHRGQRIITDTGAFTYLPGNERLYDRSTAAHNTIEIDGCNQSDVWSAFRCGRRIVAEDSAAVEEDGVARLEGAYRGPGHFLRPVSHERHFRIEGLRIDVDDRLRARGKHSGLMRLHLAPGIAAEQSEEGWQLMEGGTVLASIGGENIAWRPERSPYHPEFGRKLERTCLISRFDFRSELALEWFIQLH